MLDINSSVEANNDFGTVESRSKGQSITIPGKIKRTKPIMAKKRSENSSPDYSMQNSGSPVSHVAKTSMITPPPKIRTRGVTTNAKPEKFKIENAEANKSEKQSDHDSSISSSVQHSHVLDTTKNEMGYNIPLSKLDSPERKLIKPISLGDSGRNEKSNRSKDKSGRGSIEYSSGTEALKIDNRVNTDGSKFDEPSHTIDPTKAYADIDHITEETPKQSKKSVDPDNISSKNLSIDNQNSKSDNSLGARKSVSNVDPRFDIPKLPLSKKSSVVSSKRPSQTYVEDKKSPAAFTFNYEEVKMESSFDQGYKNQTKLISPVISVSNEQSQIIDKNNVRSAHASSGRKSIDIGIDEKQMAQQLGETQDLEKLTQALSKHTVPNKKAPNQPILIDIKALVDSLKSKFIRLN